MVSAMPKQVIVFAGAPSTSSKVAVGVGLMRMEMFATDLQPFASVTVTPHPFVPAVPIFVLIAESPTSDVGVR